MSEVVVANPFGNAPIVNTPAPLTQALVAREAAEVHAAMMTAQRFPRDPLKAMDRILAACARPGLAESAIYEYARGGQSVTGPSIRLAEALAGGWGNIATGGVELSRANGVSECLAYAWDLETNYRDEKRFQVRHWRDTKKGGYAITDERDLYELVANMGARRKRACILGVIPADVQEAAVAQCEATLSAKADVTPERIRAMLDKFMEVGVGGSNDDGKARERTTAAIARKIQRRVDTITPALMTQLGRIYNSLRDGMSKPGDWFDPDPVDPNTPPAPATKAESVADVLSQRAARVSPAPHVEAAATPEVPEAEGSTAGAGEAVEDALPFDVPEGGPLPAPVSGPDPSTEAVPDRITTQEVDAMILFLAGKLGISTAGGPVATLVAVEEKLREKRAPYSSEQIDTLTHDQAKALMTWAKKNGGAK